MQCRDHRIDQCRLVARENAERVANGVVDAAAGEIDVDVPRLFLRARLVEFGAREEGRFGRIVARRRSPGDIENIIWLGI